MAGIPGNEPDRQPAWRPVPHVSAGAERSLDTPPELKGSPRRAAPPDRNGSLPASGEGWEPEVEPRIGGSLGYHPASADRSGPEGDPEVLEIPEEARINDGLAEPPAAGGVPPAPPPPVLRPPDDSGADPRLMTYTEHLAELRDRLIKSVIGLTVAMAVAFFFTRPLFDLMTSPVPGLHLIRTGVAEMIGTYFKVAFIAGIVLSTPIWMYQLIMFVAPGLTRQEKRYLFTALPAVVASFIGGALFGYFVVLPPALRFLIGFGEDIAEPLIRVGDYVSTVSSLIFWIGVVFETPLVIFLLARLGIVTPDLLKRYRKHAIAGAFVLAAVITPTPDPVNQTLVAVPIILLFELGVLLSHLAARARAASRNPRSEP